MTSDCSTSCTCKPRRLPPTSSYRPSTVTRQTPTTQTERPVGQPGHVGRNHGAGASWSYPAVRTPNGDVTYWRDTTTSAGRWIEAPPMLAASFEAGPEWQEHCNHQHDVPWQTCDTQTACDALDRELNADRWGD